MTQVRRLSADIMELACRPATERRLLLGALTVVSCATAALSVVPTVRVPGLLRRLARIGGPGEEQPTVETLAWAVAATSRYVPGASCLPRALALHALLERVGHKARVCVGLDRCPGGDIGGHAWVETPEGRPIAGQDQGAYSPVLVLDSHDASRRAGMEPAWRRASR
jgi:hypothetical protein